MKRITSIGLLLLLLYNMFGLTAAVLLFEEDYRAASPVTDNDQWQTVKMHLPSLPYTTTWENTDGREGLIRDGNDFYNITRQRHANDTLYVTLKSNQPARDRFFELAHMIQEITGRTSDAPENPFSKAIKLLSDLAKVYLPNASIECPAQREITSLHSQVYIYLDQILLQRIQLLHSPPPELG